MSHGRFTHTAYQNIEHARALARVCASPITSDDGARDYWGPVWAQEGLPQFSIVCLMDAEGRAGTVRSNRGRVTPFIAVSTCV
jgi:hypothetical protein